MRKGDIVLIPFPFTDLSGNKNRPAIVLITEKDDVTVCFISTQFSHQKGFDVVITPSCKNGLKKESLARINKMATLDRDLILGRLGALEEKYIQKINSGLIRLLDLR